MHVFQSVSRFSYLGIEVITVIPVEHRQCYAIALWSTAALSAKCKVPTQWWQVCGLLWFRRGKLYIRCPPFPGNPCCMCALGYGKVWILKGNPNNFCYLRMGLKLPGKKGQQECTLPFFLNPSRPYAFTIGLHYSGRAKAPCFHGEGQGPHPVPKSDVCGGGGHIRIKHPIWLP